MSYCELLAFKKGGYDVVAEYKNAHGWAAYVWNALFDRYVTKETQYDSWMQKPERVWDLWKGDRLQDYEKFVLLATFDRFMIKIEDMVKAADHFFRFSLAYHNPKAVCHLDEMAKEFVNLSKQSGDYVSVGFYGMSCGENPWLDYNGETDEETRYDVTVGKRHEFVILE